MSDPYWQIIGKEPSESHKAWLDYISRGRWVIMAPGPGNRIEFIRPFTPQYNWAEGSRSIEARKGAAKMRERTYLTWLARKINVELHLLTLLRQLTIDNNAQ